MKKKIKLIIGYTWIFSPLRFLISPIHRYSTAYKYLRLRIFIYLFILKLILYRYHSIISFFFRIFVTVVTGITLKTITRSQTPMPIVLSASASAFCLLCFSFFFCSLFFRKKRGRGDPHTLQFSLIAYLWVARVYIHTLNTLNIYN